DLVGTVRYMSPEQAQGGRGLLDHRTDIYSLGATLYELLTLHPVFPGQDRQDLLRRIAFQESPSPRRLNDAVPRDLETIVLKALVRAPKGRYARAQELADDLRRFVEDRPIHARRPTLGQRLSKWARRHQNWVYASAAVLLVAVIGLSAALAKIQWAMDLAQQNEHEALANASDMLQAFDDMYLKLADQW